MSKDEENSEELDNVVELFPEDETTEIAPPQPELAQPELLFGDDSETVLPEIEEGWQGLHPYSLFINLIPQMWRTIQASWPIILFIVIGGEGAGTQFIDAGVLLIFLIISMFRTLTHFLTLRYRMQSGKLVVKVGLLFRQARTLDPARIQNIELTQNPLHKLTGLVELRIETAGDTSSKGLFSALNVDVARELQEKLQYSIRTQQKGEHSETFPDEAPILQQSIKEIILYGMSKRTVGTVVVLTAIMSEVFAFMDPSRAQQIASRVTPQVFIGLLFISFSGSWLWSSGRSLLQHYKTQLFLLSDGIRISYGLITRRKVEIPRQKIQILEIFEPWLRRQMGYGSMYIETAALGIADGEYRRSEGLIPMVPTERIEESLQWIAPRIAGHLWSNELQSAAPRALYRIVGKNLLSAAIIALLSLLFFESYGWIALFGIPFALVIGWLDWSKQGWKITESTVLSRRGYLTRRTWIMDREKIQSVYLFQDPFLRIQNLGMVVINGAGSTIYLPLLKWEDAHEVLRALRPPAAK